MTLDEFIAEAKTNGYERYFEAGSSRRGQVKRMMATKLFSQPPTAAARIDAKMLDDFAACLVPQLVPRCLTIRQS
ncbi:MAG: hypothetical protein JWR25_2094 [Noviherbaspirillum sp.]|nr:hypothetical protein [Noviherbaspirillum sp.]